MLNEHRQTAKIVEMIMQDVYTKLGIEHKTYVTSVNHHGVRLSDKPFTDPTH
jgi:homoserine kinase